MPRIGLAAASVDALCAYLHIQVSDAEGVGLDEFAAGFDEVAHQGREGLLGVVLMVDPDLQQGARLGIQGRLPELLRVHLAEALVAVDLDAAPAQLHDRLDQPRRAGDPEFPVARDELAGALVDLAQSRVVAVEPARLARSQQCRVDQAPFADALAAAAEDEALAGDDIALPAPVRA